MVKQQRRMDARMGRKTCALLLLMALFLLCHGLSVAQAQAWPTKQFVIKKHDPDAWINVPGWFPGGGFSTQQKKVVRDFETYLGEVATYFESMGFRAPRLPMTENANGDPAYLVYIYDFAPGETTALAGYFGDGHVDLRIDLSRAIINGQPSDRAYEDLAHELFHNVQRAYQTDYALDHGSWIGEGQAQAVGVDTAYKLRQVMRFKTKKEAYRLGGRPYYTPLATKDRQRTYRTSSFWRYIGEHYAASKRRKHAGVKPIPADYSYLAKVFRHSFQGPSSTTADLRWLDEALDKELGLGLNRLYANFITTFAEYVPTRLNKMSGTPEQAAATWRKYILGECKLVRLQAPFAPKARTSVKLDRNAARCFIVHAQGVIKSGWADIAITARSGSEAALEALHIGTDGGTKVSQPQVVGLANSGGGGYLGHWRFRIQMGQYQVFVISNVAEDAQNSKAQEVILDFAMSTWLSSMTQPVPQKAPVNKKPSKPSKTSKPKSAEATTKPDKKPGDLDFLTNTSALGTEVRMQAYNPGCDEPFRFHPCGPSLSIGLSLTPGALVGSDVDIAGSTGRWFGQIRNMVTNKSAIAKGRAATRKRLSQMEGAYVNIQIPDISYGFTGSFSNALITVSGRDDVRYQSIGPNDVMPQAMQPHYPLSGNVTIEEFTPVILKGRFSARLVDMDRVEPGTRTLPIHRTVDGQFSITAPWDGDPDIERMVPSDEAAIQSLTEAFPFAFGGGLKELARRHDVPFPSRPGGPSGGGPSGSSADSSAGAGFTRVRSCDCDCQPLESFSSYCRPICAVKVRYCQVGKSRAKADRQALTEAQTQARRKQAREAKLKSLSAADKRDYAAYLLLQGLAQMTHGLSNKTQKSDDMTRAEFQAYLEKAGMDENKMQKLLVFFDQERADKSP